MISSIVSRLVILVFGTLYPAYASYKAVRTRNVKEYVKWMMYWIVFALFTCAETFTDVFLSFWFPFYYEIKIILVLWLLSPATKGSSILYRRFVHPALIRREAEIDEALAKATEQGYTAVLHLGTKGVNYATTVLMQTAIKNFPNVIPSTLSPAAALAGSQSDSAISSLASPKAATVQASTTTTDSATRRNNPDEAAAAAAAAAAVAVTAGLPRRRRRRSEEPRHTIEEEESEESARVSGADDVISAGLLDSDDNDLDRAEVEYFEQPVFKVPAKQPEKARKPRKENAARRQRTARSCKETVKSYEADFSDEVEF